MLERAEQTVFGPAELELLRRHLRQAGRDAADVDCHDNAENEQPDHDSEALDDVGDGVRQQPADDRIGGDQDGRQGDCRHQAQPRVGAHDLSECPHLRRRPDHRAGQQDDDHQLLHAGRVALAKQVGKGREPPAPQGPREENADDDDGAGIADRIDEGATQPLLVDRPTRGHDRLGTEVGGKDREGDEADAEAAAGQDVVGLAGHATRYPRADDELHQHIANDGHQQPVHRFPQRPDRAQSPVNCTRGLPDATGL